MKGRLALALAVLAGWAGLLAARLYQLQVVDHQVYLEKASNQQQKTVKLAPPRGTIFDAQGRVLALSMEAESVWADRREVSDPALTAARVARVLGIDRRRLEERLTGGESNIVFLARQLDLVEARKVRELGLPEIGFVRESKRYYPHKTLAAQVLGFVGDDHVGLAGLEHQFDPLIRGAKVRRRLLRDGRLATAASPDFPYSEPEPGADLHLTLDAVIQEIVERHLARTVEKHRAKGGSALLMDPATGAVLAMASYPTFDPNRFADYPSSHWRNRAVMDAYEPGSTFKLVTAAAALEAGLVDPLDLVDCGMGGITVAKRRINDHKPFGTMTLREVFARSSNVGMIRVGLLVGGSRLHQQILDFGLGKPTGIELPAEASGIVRPVDRWRLPLSTAYISFGQEVAVTPLQLASVFAAVADGGSRHRPYLVSGIARNGALLKREPAVETLGRPIDRSTARTLERLLEAVVSEGTGRGAAIVGYRVAGKTGTGQKAIPGQGYSATRVIASFVGFAPARRPAAVALVAVDEPRGQIHGGQVAAPAFAAIMTEVLRYLGVPPDRQLPSAELIAAAEVAGPPSRSSSPAGAVAEPARVEAGSVGGVPDLLGLTARAAVVRTASLGLTVRLHGSGFVREQLPPAGTPLDGVAGEVELWLGRVASR